MRCSHPEYRVRLNDAGASNGTFEAWIDGTPDVSKSNLNWVGSYADFGINVLNLSNYWNDASPTAQERYFDDLVISTQPIGCGAAAAVDDDDDDDD